DLQGLSADSLTQAGKALRGQLSTTSSNPLKGVANPGVENPETRISDSRRCRAVCPCRSVACRSRAGFVAGAPAHGQSLRDRKSLKAEYHATEFSGDLRSWTHGVRW